MNIKDFSYVHKVQYYETDKMGIVHHSNYIRWFEEARTAVLEEMGMGYDVMEEKGLFSPIIGVNCTYLKPTTYGDSVYIQLAFTNFSGLKFAIGYKITSQDGKTVYATGESFHGLLGCDFKPINLKKTHPEVHQYFQKLYDESQA